MDGAVLPLVLAAALLALVVAAVLAGRRFAALYRAGRKRCPDCKSTIPADARVCRYCGWR